MLISDHQNAGWILNIRIGNKYLENVAKFGCLGTSVTNQH
jgi:hypothetical protein